MFDPEGFNAAAEQAIFWTRVQLENSTNDEPNEDGIKPSRRRMDFLCGLPRTVREGQYAICSWVAARADERVCDARRCSK